MLRCDACGCRLSQLRARRYWRPQDTYPIRTVAGGCREQPVRWLCECCQQRAVEIRASATWIPTPAQP